MNGISKIMLRPDPTYQITFLVLNIKSNDDDIVGVNVPLLERGMQIYRNSDNEFGLLVTKICNPSRIPLAVRQLVVEVTDYTGTTMPITDWLLQQPQTALFHEDMEVEFVSVAEAMIDSIAIDAKINT
jgi:hypothetical protein